MQFANYPNGVEKKRMKHPMSVHTGTPRVGIAARSGTSTRLVLAAKIWVHRF